MRARLLKSLLLTVTVCGLTACGTQKIFIKAYDGPDLAADRVAIVKPSMHIVVYSIDGDATKSVVAWNDFGSTDADIALKPGVHRFSVGYKGPVYRSTGAHDLVAYLAPGRKYIIVPEIKGGWRAVMEDFTSRPQQWCINYPYCRVR